MTTAYSPREVYDELQRIARARDGFDTTEEREGQTELKVEYRAAILLDQQANRIEMLEATLRSIAAGPGKDESERLADGALGYDGVPTAISTEDGDPAWVEVTPITETPEQVTAALKANGMWTVEDDGTVYGYEVTGRVWCVPGDGQTETMFLTQRDLDATHADPSVYEDSILWYESPADEGCETGQWWWRCDAMTGEQESTS